MNNGNDSAADEPPLPDRIRSWARDRAYAAHFNPFGPDASNQPTSSTLSAATGGHNVQRSHSNPPPNTKTRSPSRRDTPQQNVGDQTRSNAGRPAAPPVDAQREGEESAAMTEEETKEKVPLLKRIYIDTKMIVLYNVWINWMLIFVPVGIALGALMKSKGDDAPVTPTVVFAMNALAIIPLAGLLSFATESVASKLGDTIGALLNVTFGNAVELIIFIIALVANEIRIVQASILGSILSNLLLILGMAFLLGGLRFREQLYNSTVGQMSACLLSLSVISLLLPTAFHYSFNNDSQTEAKRLVIKVSRGTSVVLLLVYILYLLFQLKSHAYMYESTPQHLIDEESHPGVLAEFMNSSSSSDSSSTSDSDTDSSSGSHTTAKRIKRAFRRRRKSSVSSKDTTSMPSAIRTPSSHTNNATEDLPSATSPMDSHGNPRELEPVLSGDEADDDRERKSRRDTSTTVGVTSRDFQHENGQSSGSVESKEKRRRRKRNKRHFRKNRHEEGGEKTTEPANASANSDEIAAVQNEKSSPRVGFATPPVETEAAKADSPRRQYTLFSRPALPKVLSSSVFSQQNTTALPPPAVSNLQQEARVLRRTSSLPDRLNQHTHQPHQLRPPVATRASGLPVSARPLPHLMPLVPIQSAADGEHDVKDYLSRTSAVVLLLISTGLVAICAEFLVDSIDFLVEHTGVSQAFIGLIILPIVGNAAEHVTAVTVAAKNKMDLAIGVALGSSIQIALFVTPLIVLLGWILNTEMSLYFSLFETVSLFASAFIVNYLMIDGRSNYLEGALLIASYVIIAVSAFYYPGCEDANGAASPMDSSGSC